MFTHDYKRRDLAAAMADEYECAQGLGLVPMVI